MFAIRGVEFRLVEWTLRGDVHLQLSWHQWQQFEQVSGLEKT